MRSRIAIVLALVLLPAEAAHAQNLLVSPDFDVASDVDDWPDPFPDAATTIGWQSDVDLNASPGSGSLRIDSTLDNGASDGPRQCVNGGAGDYEAEVWTFNPTQPNPRTSTLFIEYFQNPGCSGPQLPFDVASAPGVPDTWEKIALSVTAPAGTMSVGVRLTSGNTFDPTSSFLFYDEVRLTVDEPTPQDFTGTLAFPEASPFFGVPGASFAGSGKGVSTGLPLNQVRDFSDVAGFTGTATTKPALSLTDTLSITGLGNPDFTGTPGGGLHGPLAVRGLLRRQATMTTLSFTFTLTSMGTRGLGLGGTLPAPAGGTVIFGTWTTGMVIETGVLKTPFGGTGTYSATGSDARTADGAGMVRLVAPVRATGSGTDVAMIAELTLDFAPEPGRAALLAAGSAVLFGLGWRRRRGRA